MSRLILAASFSSYPILTASADPVGSSDKDKDLRLEDKDQDKDLKSENKDKDF